ncbi:crooked neck-like protein 1 [Limanda limanda]|uniref:crooked neck-like protein 1 n=1 Tax=Limanda limanda TaxID=27771 RepID=UPI0029C6D340|nr:crooked neck-like protein 1 [Limanda limanda]
MIDVFWGVPESIEKPWAQLTERLIASGCHNDAFSIFRIASRTLGEDVPEVWIGFANTKGKLYGSTRLSRCRDIFEEANQSLRTCQGEDRIKLLHAWYSFERENGSQSTEDHVLAKMPQQERRMRRVVDEDGEERSEEYTDFTFPEETAEQHQD